MSGTTVVDSSMPKFRQCAVTGLRVHSGAELFIKLNAVAAVVCFLVGVVAAIGLVLTRWQAIHLLDVIHYYRFLTLHGLNMLIFFIIFFEMAVLYFAGPVVLNSRLPAPGLAWLSFLLMVAGAFIVNYDVLSGTADVLFTSYPPLKAAPSYYLGIILFAVGALIVCGLFFASLVVAKREKTYTGSVPLVTFGALTAAIIAVITLVHGALIYIPAWLWSMDMISLDPQVYRLIFWGLGHSSQQINVAAMVAVWYLLGGLTVGAVVLNEKISRTAFFLYILFISMASAHHLLVDPGFGAAWKIWNTSYAMYLAVLASMIHGFTVPAGLELGQRLRGYTKGYFEWLRRAPWGDPGFSGMVLSVIIFGFMGGITGVTMGAEQINIMLHNTLRVPGHFHVTVVGGTALAFMAVTYYVLPLIFRKRIRFWALAKLQPYIFAFGIATMSIGMSFMGSFGVPRRHYDIKATGAPFALEFHSTVDLLQVLFGVGGLIAAAGALIYILVTVASVFFGRPYDPVEAQSDPRGLPQGVLKLPAQQHSGVKVVNAEKVGTPGTVILVGVFFVCFVLYYSLNWFLLSFLWKMG